MPCWRRLLATLILLTAVLRLPAQTPRTLTCTVMQPQFEYTLDDLHGPRPEFDRQLCLAVAAALGPGTRVGLVDAPDETTALAALRAGKVDLIPTVSASLAHATDPTLTLAPPILMDGTGLLVSVATTSVASLAGRKICFFAETETETDLHTWSRLHHLDFLSYPFSEEGEMQAAFTSGNCPAIAGDLTRLAAVRTATNTPDRYKLLPDVLAPDPLAPATRRADAALARVVYAVEQLLLSAAALGVTRENLPSQLHTGDPTLERLLGRTHELGPAAGLDDGWPSRVLERVGSYTDLARTMSVPLPTPPALPLR